MTIEKIILKYLKQNGLDGIIATAIFIDFQSYLLSQEGKEEQKIDKCINCKHFQKKLFDANVENDTLRMELDQQAELANKSHTLICSLKIIAERNGESTY